jgi:hypothetical protein
METWGNLGFKPIGVATKDSSTKLCFLRSHTIRSRFSEGQVVSAELRFPKYYRYVVVVQKYSFSAYKGFYLQTDRNKGIRMKYKLNYLFLLNLSKVTNNTKTKSVTAK